MKKLCTFIVIFVLCACFLSDNTMIADIETYAASGINVNYRTADEIKEYISEHPYDFSESEYVSEPDYINAPYALGKLSTQTLNNALNALNTMRYIAGLGEVSLSDYYNELAQAASLVNAVNDDMSHYPSKPDDMSSELYSIGATGASKSNLGYGYSYGYGGNTYSLAFFVESWMEDSVAGNIDRLGHRRWCLNPQMGRVGFGNVGNYYAMYALDYSNFSKSFGVCWPAQKMPVKYFKSKYAWSISIGEYINKTDINVKLVRKSDGKKWNFYEGSEDGYFNVNNDEYAQPGCIIFRPDDISYSAGDIFEVSVTGLKNNVSYTVEFFELDKKADNPESDEKTDNSELDEKVDNNGDCNQDGIVDAIDVKFLSEYLVNKITFNDTQKNSADFNLDKTINVFDVIKLRRFLISKKKSQEYAEEVVGLINKERLKNGNTPLNLNQTMCDAAMTIAKNASDESGFDKTFTDTVLNKYHIIYSKLSTYTHESSKYHTPKDVVDSDLVSYTSDMLEIGVGYYYNPNSNYSYAILIFYIPIDSSS